MAMQSTGNFRLRLSPERMQRAVLRIRELGVFGALVVLIIAFSAGVTNFATISNWQSIANDVALVLIVAVGQTMVILTRNIDLSVGSVVGLSGYVSAYALAHDTSLPTVVIALLSIAIGLGCGLVNGALVVFGKVPAIIATLATQAIFRGIDYEITNGNQINSYQLPHGFLNLAVQTPLGLPWLAWVALIVVVIGAIALKWMPWARDFFAIGSNPAAARLVGIPVSRRVMSAFAISGALAGLGGFIFVAQYGSIDSSAGTGLEFTVIAAVVIGGVNVFGGSGSILGASLGAILIATISSGFTEMKLPYFWLTFVEGAALVLAITGDALLTRRLQAALRRRQQQSARMQRSVKTQGGGE